MSQHTSESPGTLWGEPLCRERFDELLASSEDSFFLLDREGRYQYAFGRDLPLWGYDRDAYIGKKPRDMWPMAAQYEPFEKLFQSVLTRGFQASEEFAVSTFFGLRSFSYTCHPIKNAQGHVEAVSLSVRDISERKQVEGLLSERETARKPYTELFGTAIHDPSGVVSVDQDLADMLGYAAPDLIGRPVTDLLGPGGQLFLDDSLQAPVQAQARTHDGRLINVEIRTERVPLDGTSLTMTTFFNLEEQQRSAWHLLETEAAWQSLAGSTPQYLITTDSEGVVTYINRVTPGFTREQFIGTSMFDFMAPTIRKEKRRLFKEVMQTGKTVHHDSYFHEPVLGTLWFRSTMAPLRRGDEVVGMVMSAVDITEFKRVTDSLAQREQELATAQEVNRLKDLFISALTHELRTPLTSIVGYVGLLENPHLGRLSEDQRQYVNQIGAAAKRQSALVDTLLDVVRLEGGVFRLNCRDTDLGQVLEQSITALQPLIQDAGLTLTVAPVAGPLSLSMDPQRVDVVISNLLTNAIKFTPRGGQIRVSAAREGEAIRVEVTDTGPGISCEDQPKLFQRFSQLEAGLRAGTGLGLGLSICKAIVETHGGTIGVESAPGHGSTFWFTLPLQPSADPDVCD